MEYEFEDLASILNDSFTRDDAEKRRQTIVKKTRDGRRHWFPVELNGGINLERRDVAWEYGMRTASGAFYCTTGRIGFDEHHKQWKQVARDDEESFRISTPIVLFDKIKVLSCVLLMENASRTMALTGVVGVQRETEKAGNRFLQEVSKFDTKGTVARYKMSDLSNLKHAHFNASDETCTVNINMPRGFYELAVNLRSISAWYRSKNSQSRMIPRIVPEEENNNSITVDSVISAVRNEFTFKEKAVESKIFPIRTKSKFRTHKYIVRYSGQYKLSGKNADSYADVMNAVSCDCSSCKENVMKGKKRDTFHRYKESVMSVKADAKHRKRCLAPLYHKNEIQVHDRCFNCSAVAGNKLLPVVCEMGGKLLKDDQTALIDLALVRATAQLELQSNGLLPSHSSTLCELLCWQEKTRDMSKEQQMMVYKTKIEPALTQLQLSRQNYAQSGGLFCQVLLRGNKLILQEDQSLVSHKYKNQSTMNIFKARKRCASEDDSEKVKLSKNPRRSRGPVFMATSGLHKFKKRMLLHSMDFPREDEM